MGVHKGTDNFQVFRTKKAEDNLTMIRNALRTAKKRKSPYRNLSSLIADLSDRTGIHRTTLARNPAYRKACLLHLASQPGASQVVSEDDASPELLRSMLIDLRLEINQLQRRIAEHEKKAHAQEILPVLENKTLPNEPDWYVDFANTSMLLKEFIDRQNKDYEVIDVNLATGDILDLSEPQGHQLVASGSRTRAFIDFYRKLLIQEGKLKEK